MSAVLVLMVTDGQDTQKRTEDLQQAGDGRWPFHAGTAGITAVAEAFGLRGQ